MRTNMTWFHDDPELPAAETIDDFVWTPNSGGSSLTRVPAAGRHGDPPPARGAADSVRGGRADSPAAIHRRWLHHGPTSPDDGSRHRRERPWIADLAAGIELDEFFLEYQPIVSLATGQLEAFEALVRWRHPQRGVLGPAAFIEDAELAGLLPLLTPKILADACAAVATWNDDRNDLPPIAVTINLGGSQLRADDLLPRVAAAITENGLAAGRVWFEITEDTGARYALADLRVLHELRRMGTKLALDDFGAGCASIGCLRNLPIDAVKIDRSLILQATATRSGERVLAASTEIARALGIITIAEGIGRPDHLACARKLGCQFGQGFYFTRAVSRAEADRLTTTSPPWRVGNRICCNPHVPPSEVFSNATRRLTIRETANPAHAAKP